MAGDFLEFSSFRYLELKDMELVKNTLVFSFPPGAPGPSLVEMARFAKSLDGDLDSMETMYKVSEERCVFVKFKSVGAMKEAREQNPEILPFRYSNGNKVEVKMDIAGNYAKYVRIFDLPPEVPDSEITAVLGKYGSVKRLVREKFPAELELNMFTGVRGVYIEVKKEIPASLFFLNRRGRIFYDGLKQKCFICKQEGHLKVDCPQNKTKTKNVESTELQQECSSGSKDQTAHSSSQLNYAGVVSGATSKRSEERIEVQMVTLVPANKQTKVLDAQVNESKKEDTVVCASMEVDDGADKSAVKRQHSAAGDSGETDEDVTSGFAQVESKRSSRRMKVSLSPLEAIASVPKQKKVGKNEKRSSSK